MTLTLFNFRFNQVFSIHSLISHLNAFSRSSIVSAISLSREKIAEDKKLYVEDLVQLISTNS
jgi:hypothetical protein